MFDKTKQGSDWKKLRLGLIAILILGLAIFIVINRRQNIGENWSYWQEDWYKYIDGVEEVVLVTPTVDDMVTFKVNFSSPLVNDLVKKLNFCNEEIKSLGKIAELLAEVKQIEKELWYLETLPGRMPEEIRTSEWSAADEIKNKQEIDKRKARLQKVLRFMKKEVVGLRTTLRKKGQEYKFREWVKIKKR